MDPNFDSKPNVTKDMIKDYRKEANELNIKARRLEIFDARNVNVNAHIRD